MVVPLEGLEVVDLLVVDFEVVLLDELELLMLLDRELELYDRDDELLNELRACTDGAKTTPTMVTAAAMTNASKHTEAGRTAKNFRLRTTFKLAVFRGSTATIIR